MMKLFVRDGVNWNTMVVGCLRNLVFGMGSNLFRKMNRRRANDSLETFNEMQFCSVDLFKPEKTTIATHIM
jgi:hypothetical protein